MKININRQVKHQTITGFGVSGAWWAQEAGGFTEAAPDRDISVREYIAKLLFDPNDGIGITQYRYNLGAGSAQSGEGNFSNPDRRARCFEVSARSYDWNLDAEAVWMMRAAARYGVDEITFFVNSPIERLTKNHKSHLDKPLRTNLPAKNIDAFAQYCADVAEHFISEGLPVKYISPINEPVWVWTGGQEGCHYRPYQAYKVMKALASEIEKRSLPVKISGAENGDVRWFNKVYAAVMCADPDVRKHIDSVDIHSYFLPGPLSALPSFISGPLLDRTAFLRRWHGFMNTVFPGVPIKVSEWCHMKGGRDRSIFSALEQAKVMAEDLTYLNAIGWQEWVALSYVDYCDGLIYYNPDHSLELTKRYYGFGNFSKFVRPGAVRIEAEWEDDSCQVLAFEQGEKTVVIIINHLPIAKSISLSTEGRAEMYITDSKKSLEKTVIENTADFEVPAKSINTLII